MSEELTEIQRSIPDYAGVGDASARRRSDQQVRAWVGEHLAALRERLASELGASATLLDDVILRCEFGDQRVIKAIEAARFDDPACGARLTAHNALLVSTMAGSASVDAAGLAAFVTALDAALTQRVELILAT
jgi:hypothetical protein